MAVTLNATAYCSLIALILPVIFIYFAISVHSCFYSKPVKHWIAFMCWCAVQ